MTKYFVNLIKLKEYAKLYKQKPLMRKILIAGIGNEHEVEYKIFLDAHKTKPNAFCLEVKNKLDDIEEIVELEDNWINVIKNTVQYYDNGLDADTTYYCHNPACKEFGEVLECLDERNGKYICPECGCWLSTEEPACSISYDRLIEIIELLWFSCGEEYEEFSGDLCDCLGVDIDEIDEILSCASTEER